MVKPGSVAIVGAAELVSPQGVFPELSQLGLHAEAAIRAMKETGLRPADIDGVACAGASPTEVAWYLGITPKYVDGTAVGGCSFMIHVRHAVAAIESGLARTILITHGESGKSGIGRGGFPGGRQSLNMQFEQWTGPMGPPTMFTVPVLRYMKKYGVSEEQLAMVAVVQREYAAKNPNAMMKDPITVEDVLNSPIVVSPLHIFEIVYPCDGAMAMIVSRADDAKAITKTPVYVEGAGFYADHLTMASAPAFRNGLVSPVKVSAEQAFKMAGITPKDVDVLGIYDCYTIVVIMTLEDMGFCKKGEGGHFVQEHDLTFKGDLPVNTSGGQLSVGQPGDAGGMVNVIEVVRQLMGKAGERQIPDAEIGVTNSNGGLCMDTECTLVLRRG